MSYKLNHIPNIRSILIINSGHFLNMGEWVIFHLLYAYLNCLIFYFNNEHVSVHLFLVSKITDFKKKMLSWWLPSGPSIKVAAYLEI